jgi:hypothetical protein
MVALGPFTQSCKKGGNSACKDADPAHTIPVAVQRLELTELPEVKDSISLAAFLAKHPLIASDVVFAGIRTRPDSAESRKVFISTAFNPYADTLRQDVAQYFPDDKRLDAELGGLFGRVKDAWPDFVPPRAVYTMTTGFGFDFVYADSMLAIGLEYFLPAQARYHPPAEQLPGYYQVRLRPWTVVPTFAKVLSNRYNKMPAIPDLTMVEEMIGYGKTLYFMEQTMPCLGDTTIAGYSDKVMEDVNKNASVIYAHFVDRNLFFNKESLLKAKYVGERPAVPEIGDDCPGRIGQWMGWQIVRKWAKDKNLTLAQVMAESDGQKIFNEARWKPEK